VSARKRSRLPEDFPSTFLPHRIGRAADVEMAAVLAEDEALRLLRQAKRKATR
jgi:hypothetical protein